MKTRAGVYVWALCLWTTSLVRADSIVDPKIIIARGVSQGSAAAALTSPLPITTLGFTVKANLNGGGLFDFINETGQTWTGLTFTVNLPAAFKITCESTIFADCSVTKNHNIVTISLSGGKVTSCHGTHCSASSEFSINLNDSGHANNGKGGWGGRRIIAGQATTAVVPEPSTMLLTGFGGFCICLSRRLRGRKRADLPAT